MAMAIAAGQEMKMTIKSADSSGNRNKTIRYVDPLAENTVDVKVTGLAKDLMANSQNVYTATSAAIELGILSES